LEKTNAPSTRAINSAFCGEQRLFEYSIGKECGYAAREIGICIQLAHQQIGVDEVRASRLQHARDGAFATGDVARQPQQNHKRAVTAKARIDSLIHSHESRRSLPKLGDGNFRQGFNFRRAF
jgi:hypothetical protein